jgi:asparagine synthase (glutamine-hydrolysing)
LFRRETFFDALKTVVPRLDQPFAEGSFLPYFTICREASRDVRVLLAGEGADELFGGYEIYRALLYKRMLARMPPGWTRMLRCLADCLPVSFRKTSLDLKLKRFFENAGEDDVKAHVSWRRAFSYEQLERMYAPGSLACAQGRSGALSFAREIASTAQGMDPINRHLFLDQKLSLVSDLLYRADLMSMWHTMELRVPFLQRDMLDLGARISGGRKVSMGADKILFRRIAAKYLPRRIAYKCKKGFNIPYAAWLAEKQGNGFLKERILDAKLVRMFFHRPVLEKMLDEYSRKKVDHSHGLWTLLILCLWHEAQEKNVKHG